MYRSPIFIFYFTRKNCRLCDSADGIGVGGGEGEGGSWREGRGDGGGAVEGLRLKKT